MSACDDVMIGRGAVADPFLARRIQAINAGEPITEQRNADWLEFLPLLAEYWQQVHARVEGRHAPGRLKLWLNSLRRTFVEAEALYWAVRPLRDVQQTSRMLEQHAVPLWRGALPHAA